MCLSIWSTTCAHSALAQTANQRTLKSCNSKCAQKYLLIFLTHLWYIVTSVPTLNNSYNFWIKIFVQDCGLFAAQILAFSCHNQHCYLWLRYLEARSRIVRWKYQRSRSDHWPDHSLSARSYDNLNMRPRATWATFLAFCTQTLHTQHRACNFIF